MALPFAVSYFLPNSKAAYPIVITAKAGIVGFYDNSYKSGFIEVGSDLVEEGVKFLVKKDQKKKQQAVLNPSVANQLPNAIGTTVKAGLYYYFGNQASSLGIACEGIGTAFALDLQQRATDVQKTQNPMIYDRHVWRYSGRLVSSLIQGDKRKQNSCFSALSSRLILVGIPTPSRCRRLHNNVS